MIELSQEVREAIAAEVARQLPPRHEEYLTAKQAAALMQCNPQTALRLAHAGKIKAVGSGRLLRIVRSSIDQYLQEA